MYHPATHRKITVALLNDLHTMSCFVGFWHGILTLRVIEGQLLPADP